MARNGSGAYSAPSNSWNPAVSGTTIDQDDWNTLLADIETALSDSIAKDGQTTTSASIPFASGLKSDTVSELSSNTGVTVDGVLLKDGGATLTGSVVFEGATADDFETTLAVTDPTADRTITLPDATGTVALDPMTTRGDIIYRNSSNATARLAIGAADTAPVSDGTDLSYVAILKQGTHTIGVPAAAMYARTTNGASAGSTETSTNKVMVKTFNFDASTDEFVQFQIPMPKSWNEGTVTAEFIWSHPSTTTNFAVVWGIQGLALGDSDALDAAFGTAQTVTDTGGTTDDIFISAATSAVTIAGTPAAGDMVIFQVYRDADNGSDTMAVDARLHAVRINFTINAADDS